MDGAWVMADLQQTQDCTSAEGQVQQAACFESLKTHGDPTNQCGWTASLAAGAWGAAVVGASNSNQPGARWKPSQQNLFQKNKYSGCQQPPRMCQFHVALRRRNVGIHCSDGDGDVIKRTRPADYRTIYCVPIIPSVVSAGT